MQTNGTGPRRYQRRSSPAFDGPGSGRGRRPGVGGRRGNADASLAARTTVRALVAAGAYVAQDMRDPDGLMRPTLRKTALRLAVSRQPALRRLGSAYLRGDPPTPEELPAPPQARALPAAEKPATVGAPPQALGPRRTIDIGPAAGRGAV
jgi:hypothetical protein